jgi:O-antigen/teichoic acid export membrane protein
VARGGTLNLVGAGVAAAMTVGLTVLVTRHFSKYTAGSFFAATSAFLIVEMIATLGVQNGLVYFIARFRSLGEEARIPAVLRSALIPVTVVSVALAVVMLVFAGPLAHLLLNYHKGSGDSGSTGNVEAITVALRWLAVLVPFGALETALLGATRGYHDMRATVVVDRVGVSTTQLLAVLVAVATGAAAFLAPLWALPYLPASVIAWFWLRRIQRDRASRRVALPDVPPELAALLALATPATSALSGVPARAARSARHVGARLGKRLASTSRREFWRFTTPRAVATVTSTIIQRVDIVIIAIIRGPAEAAIYTAATRFLVLGQFAGSAISRSSQPRLAELFAVRDRRGTNLVYQATTAWLILLTWPIYLLAVVYGQQVLVVFGHSYKAGYAAIVVLSIVQLSGAVFGQVDVVLITAGKSSWSMLNGLLVMVTNIALDLWLIPPYGILGAAVAWGTAITVSNVVPLIQLATVFRLHPFGRTSLTATVLTVVSFLLVPLAIRAALGSSWLSLVAGVAAGSVLMGVGVLRLRGVLKLQGVVRLPRGRARQPGRA